MADLEFKYRKKAVRDIYLSSDIGRESPFDPFKDRTVTKFMTNPNTFISDGMYFAEKSGRRVPNMVKYDTIRHHANVRVEKLIEEGGIPATRKEDEELNSKGYEKPSYLRDVSFTKAPRFGREDNPIQQRKRLMEEREERLRKEKFKNSTRHDNATIPDIVKTPDFFHAPTFGTPPPKTEYSLLKGQPKFTVFNFEKHEEGGSSRSARGANGTHSRSSLGGYLPLQSSVLLPPRSESAPLEMNISKKSVTDSNNSVVDNSAIIGGEHSDLFHSTRALLTSAADAQEAWEAKRKATLAKHGMITGSRRELLKAKALAKRGDTVQGIADFSLLAPRDAPMGFQPKGKEVNDLLYLPKYTATSRDIKQVADVRIDRYAGRTAKTSELKDSVDKLLTIENLSKFYKTQAEKERNSVFITPDEQAMFSQPNREQSQSGSGVNGGGGSLSRSRRLGADNPPSVIDPLGPIEPFSPFDDYSLHPPTPPKGTQTRKFTKTPDLAAFADRAHEPLSAILGGDRAEREKKARQALRREGLL